MHLLKTIKAALLFSIVCAIIVGSSNAEHLHECSGEFLRLDSNRLYFWVDSPTTINSDFSIEIQRGGSVLYNGNVSSVLDKVAVSTPLPDNIIEVVKANHDIKIIVFLDSDLLCDSLVIAMPSNLREIWLDTIFTTNANPQQRYLFRYYDDMREVEIASKLQQVDLLILPESELPTDEILADSPYLLEWNLVNNTIKDDLLATALNDCVRGLFANSTDRAYSSLINQEHLENVFPRNTTHARELFSQSKRNKERFDCYFPGFRMYPLLGDRINFALDSCSGRRVLLRDSTPQPLSLILLPVDVSTDTSSRCTPAIQELADPIRRILDIKSATRLDSCLLGTIVQDSCYEELSRSIAESVRIIPLGRTKLAIRHFSHTRLLDHRSGQAHLFDYYTVKQ